MKHVNQRNIRIVDELMNFCAKLGADKFQIEVANEEKETQIFFRAYIKYIDEETLETMKKLLSSPRYHEMEEYYWNLPGDDDTDTELTLVGMMTDQAEVKYVNGEYLDIKLKRIK